MKTLVSTISKFNALSKEDKKFALLLFGSVVTLVTVVVLIAVVGDLTLGGDGSLF